MSFCGRFVFVHSFGMFSSGLTDAVFAAVLRSDLAGEDSFLGFKMGLLIVLVSLWPSVVPCD